MHDVWPPLHYGRSVARLLSRAGDLKKKERVKMGFRGAVLCRATKAAATCRPQLGPQRGRHLSFAGALALASWASPPAGPQRPNDTQLSSFAN